jgi:hypothetical protein
MDVVGAKFVIRAQYDRKVELYKDRLNRWEEELLNDLVATVYLPLTLRVACIRARKMRHMKLKLGWLKTRLPMHSAILIRICDRS